MILGYSLNKGEELPETYKDRAVDSNFWVSLEMEDKKSG